MAMTARRCDKPEDETGMEWYAGGVEPIGGSGTRRRTNRMVVWAGPKSRPCHLISLSLTKTNLHLIACPNPRNILWCVSASAAVLLWMDRQFSLCKAKRVEEDRKININAPHTPAVPVQCSASAVPRYSILPSNAQGQLGHLRYTIYNNQPPIPISFPLPHKILKLN